ncbi:hypothetical protein MHK_000965 [Candidatus Magnetomorum sp. HK-1]|nr:hypothetical protein MHK_000965 [Candidatus Magnetomorum sp. HK-1]
MSQIDKYFIDVFAKASGKKYSLIGEVKNRKAKFSLKEAKLFLEKSKEVKELENLGKTVAGIT